MKKTFEEWYDSLSPYPWDIEDEYNAAKCGWMAALENSWIKCSDRMPEKYAWVLCWSPTEFNVPTTCNYNGPENGVEWWDNGDWRMFNKVTHWMPLPEPPKS